MKLRNEKKWLDEMIEWIINPMVRLNRSKFMSDWQNFVLFFQLLMYWKQNAPGLTLRRGSAPTALHPVNWQLDCNRTKRPAVHLGRHGSLRLSKYDHNAPDFRRRGSLPYELGSRKIPPINSNEPSNFDCTSTQVFNLSHLNAVSYILCLSIKFKCDIELSFI